jgi:hypothetical protein
VLVRRHGVAGKNGDAHQRLFLGNDGSGRRALLGSDDPIGEKASFIAGLLAVMILRMVFGEKNYCI